MKKVFVLFSILVLSACNGSGSGDQPPPIEEDLFVGVGGAADKLLGKGWHDPESWGRWTAEREAEIQILRPRKAHRALRLDFLAAQVIAPTGAPFPVTVTLQETGEIRQLEFFGGEAASSRSLCFTGFKNASRGETLTFRIKLSMIHSPKEIGLSDDPRSLGMGLNAIRLGESCQ